MHQQTPRKAASWATLAIALAVLGCGDAATGPDPDPIPQLLSVSVESSIATVIAVARTAQLTATVTDSDGDVVSAPGMTWQTSDADVAAVNGNGLVTGVGPGQAVISAKHGGATGSLSIAVIDADLDAIAQLRNDPLVILLIRHLDSELAQGLTAALNELDGAVTVGNCIAVNDALEAALAGTSGSTNPSDVVSLAVLGLVLERARALLGL